MPIDGMVETDGHTTFYIEDGPKDGPLMMFIHGWPSCRTAGGTSCPQWLG